MGATLRQTFLSFEGRFSRRGFWTLTLLFSAIFVVLFVFLEDAVSRRATLLLYPPFLWLISVVAIKRIKDRGRHPLTLAAVLIPVLGPIWLTIELGFRRGTIGANQYGPDPYDERGDYMVVE